MRPAEYQFVPAGFERHPNNWMPYSDDYREHLWLALKASWTMGGALKLALRGADGQIVTLKPPLPSRMTF